MTSLPVASVTSDAPRAEAVIDRAALASNIRLLIERVKPAGVMLAVKADAYGHGIIEVASVGLAAGVESLAVLDVAAGLQVRRAGIDAPVLAWLHGPDTDFRAAAEADIELGISAIWQIDAISASGADRPAVLHLKVDTGLSRNGATATEWPALVSAALAAQSAGAVRIRGAWSHLADASEAEDEAARIKFLDAVRVAEELGAQFEVLHLAASSAGWRSAESRFSFVRFGIAAYGISPFDDSTGAELGLTPPMTLRAPVTATNVGESRLVRVGIGFADGVPTIGIPHARVLLNGTQVPVVSIDVDSILIDPKGASARVGDAVTIFGPGHAGEPTAEKWADWAKTIADEIVTGVSQRVPRIYL